MIGKAKEFGLIACLFAFLFVVIGGGLHLTPGAALLASATGTPLAIRMFVCWSRRMRPGALATAFSADREEVP
jgi:hypothetical protein